MKITGCGDGDGDGDGDAEMLPFGCSLVDGIS
jgi:hypothetical protein